MNVSNNVSTVFSARVVLFCCLAIVLSLVSFHVSAQAFDAGRSAFSVRVNDRIVSYHTTFQMALPKQELKLQFPDIQYAAAFELSGPETRIRSVHGQIVYQSPASPGHYPLEIVNTLTGDRVQLHLFVVVPAAQVTKGSLNGYRIGDYPPPYKGLTEYKAPLGYIRVDKDIEGIQVSPHFRLGQFLCKQQSDYPKYIVLKPRLLEKLELLLADVNQKGIRTDSFVIMSGYRTPYYNRAIGNVASSRHLYGGAADIYIDVNPENNTMDDLNGDGKSNFQDAVYLYNLADGLTKRHTRSDLIGGLGKYHSNAQHGPFVHVDVRGNKARWSD